MLALSCLAGLSSATLRAAQSPPEALLPIIGTWLLRQGEGMCHVKAALGGVKETNCREFHQLQASLLWAGGERAFQAANNDAKGSSICMCYFLNCTILIAAVELLSPSSTQPVLGNCYITVSGV